MATPLVITLPIPDRRISPNAARGQSLRAALGKARMIRRHKTNARLRTLELLGEQYHRHGLPVPTFAGYSIAHYFETARFRDDDNADGACKAYRDGIAAALGLDDKHLRKLALSSISKDAANPRVEITLHLSPPAVPEN